MSATFQFDDKEFAESLRWLAARSTKTLQYYIDRKMFFIAKHAAKETPMANREQIRAELMTQRKVTVTYKSGKTGLRTKTFASTTAQRIIQAARYKEGGKDAIIKDYAELQMAAKKFVTSRLRGVGTLKAGWFGIMAQIRKKLKSGIETFGNAEIGFSGRPPRVKRAGRFYRSKSNFKHEAVGVYKLLAKDRNSHLHIHPSVVDALRKAWAYELRDMKAEIARRLQKDMNKIQAR